MTGCPRWCLNEHAQRAREVDGLTAAEIAEHFAQGGEFHLDDLAAAGAAVAYRPGGGGWDLTISQGAFDAMDGRAGLLDQPLIDLRVHQRGAGESVRLTTGELRVLAAQLLAAADMVDLDESRPPA